MAQGAGVVDSHLEILQGFERRLDVTDEAMAAMNRRLTEQVGDLRACLAAMEQALRAYREST